jgi:glycogen debranching enzyme
VQFARYAHPYLEMIGALDNFYAKQHPDGFISREINKADGQDIYYRSIADAANPPLYSWAEWRHYQFTGDSSRFTDVLVPIAKHYDWLQRNRRRASGTYWNTGLGAGEDDLQRGDAYSWLDMTAQQAQNALCSGLIATATSDDALAAFFLDEYLSLGDLLRDRFWDPAAAIFTDLRPDDQPTGIKTVLAFWPLLAHVGSPAQARSLAEHLQNPAEFWRPDVIPALAADESGYTPGGQYWNGAVWAPTNYMALSGLQDYGFHDLAGAVARIYLSNLAAVFDATGTIWEHYAPESATGEGFKDFVGWSGLGPIAVLIESVLGIRVDAAAHSITWRPMLAGRNGIQNLSFGGTVITLIASPVGDGQRTLSITTSTPVRIAVDTGAYQGTYVVSSGTQDMTVPASHW